MNGPSRYVCALCDSSSDAAGSEGVDRDPMIGGDVTGTTIVVFVGRDHLLDVGGRLDTDAGRPQFSRVPIESTNDLEVTVWKADYSLKSLGLYGKAQLGGPSLVCGLARPRRLAPPAAAIPWGPNALNVLARTDGGLRPVVTVLGDADVAASFESNEWSTKRCDDALLPLGADSLEPLDCLELSTSGLVLRPP